MLRTSMNFLQRDPLYQTEKPYLCLFETPVDFPKSNIRLSKSKDLVVEDVRDREGQFSLDKHGFAVMRIVSKLSYNDFNDIAKVKSQYLREVANLLRCFCNASRVQIFEHVVRKRHEIFPISTGEPYRYNQPTSIAHIDTTPEWTREMVRKLNPSTTEQILRKRVQCVNVWKPLRGPVRDWPLAICDASTVDPSDVLPGDLVYGDYVVENCQVHESPHQKWYYLRDQGTEEAWVFIQSDSASSRPGVPHSSFPNPLATENDIPRESIEVRALVYY